MPGQPTLFSFFNKTPNNSSKNNSGIKNKDSTPLKENKNALIIKLRGNDIKSLDLVWAKLEGYPWWPAIVYPHPTEEVIYKRKQVHVQFFDDPPTRGWVREAFIKPYEDPATCGVPSYKDPLWIKAKEEADLALPLQSDQRMSLIVPMIPSGDESSEGDSYMEDSETSKENVDANISNGKKRPINRKEGNEPETKKRRILLMSDSEEPSEDEYKPDKDDSDDDSVSSGVDENQISELEPDTESEGGTPVKKPAKRKLISNGSNPKAKKNICFTPKSSPKPFSSNSPNVSTSTKLKLASFAAKDTPSKPSSKDEGDWPHTHIPWLKPDKIRDRDGHSKNHPDYDPRTIYAPDDFLNKQTPAMRQWWEIKSLHFDTILFFKMGKFYELFHMDAILSIQELGLLMMKGDYAHTGFPEIAYGRYSAALIEKGYKVARIEQVETPDMMEKRCKSMIRPTKYDKVVKRELCQVTSLGTRVPSVMDGEAADSDQRFLLAITERLVDGPGDLRRFGVAFIDTAVGTFKIGQFRDDRHVSRLRTLLAHNPPAQILVEKNRITPSTMLLLKAVVPANLLESLVPEKEFWSASKTLTYLAESDIFMVENKVRFPDTLKSMTDEGDSLCLTPKDEYDLGISAFGGLIWYLQLCKLEEDLLSRKLFEAYEPIDQLSSSSSEVVKSSITTRKHMIVDGVALRNLEIFENSSNGSSEGTLFEVLNHCSTPFGKRLLRSWICTPLCNKSAIDSRLDAIEDLRNNPEIVETVKPLLKRLPDLEKLLSKIHSIGLKHSENHPDTRAILFEAKQYNQRKVMDFLSAVNGFKTTMQIIKSFKGAQSNFKSSLLKACTSLKRDGGSFFSLDDVLKFFDNAFDHSVATKEGKIIPSEGVDKEYDAAMKTINETTQSLNDYLKEQCKFFGAKVTYWGNDRKRYQLEVPDFATKKVDDSYELVSQKKGYKRYWTEETKQFLQDMAKAEEERETCLQDIARRIFHQFDEHHKEWASAVECIAVLDVLLSLKEYSLLVESTRPVVESPSSDVQPFINIREGRHPCSIKVFSGGEYIPNDLVLGVNEEDSHAPLILVTGPNMGGKSTLMRQTALICLLAQLGSFVPASECRFSAIDRIFTRLGAWDRIFQGESTFYVELAETASIIQHATTHSLVIVDELGRGTATYDGTAIAHSVVNALTKINCRTLFSTHYHSLVDEFGNNEGISLGHMACMVETESDDPSQETITFLYKFAKGACPKSYGFNAARLADLPESVIQSASKKAKELETINRNKKLFQNLFCHFPCDLRFVLQEIKSIA